MFPFHINTKTVEWSEVKKITVVKYDGIKEYFGFGFRYMPGKGWCYTITGDYGIRIVFTNEKRILIGTHKAKELSKIIDDFINRGIITN